MPAKILLLQITMQALASIAIAGGLIYAAIQFRQTRKAQLVTNFSKLVELQYHLRELRVHDPSIASVHALDVAHLGSEREIQEYFLNLMQLSLFEIAWYAHDQGQLSDDYFDSWAKRMRQLAREESFVRTVRSPAVKIMHDGFEKYVRGLVDSAAAAPAAVSSGRSALSRT